MNKQKPELPGDNIWMGLILGTKEENIEDIFVSNKALESVASITNWLKTQKHFNNTPEEAVRQIAVNVLTGHVLKIQREISPNGHKAVFINSFAEHPDMVEVRRSIQESISTKTLESIKKTFSYAFLIGAFFGVTILTAIQYFNG